MEIMQHEKEAAEIIGRQPRILLFDAMGVGKTISVLEGLKKASDGYTQGMKCIVCAPNTILGQWVDEIDQWLGLTDFNCVVASGSLDQRSVKYNYYNSVNDKTILLLNYNILVKDSVLDKVKANILILDEGYIIRNKNTKAYQYIKNHILEFDKVIILSGNKDSFTDVQFYNIVELMFPGQYTKSRKQDLYKLLGEKFISRDLSSVYTIKNIEIKSVGQELSKDQKRLLSSVDIEENRLRKTSKYNYHTFNQHRQSILNSPRIQDKTLGLSFKEQFMLDKINESKSKIVIYCPDKKFFNLLKSDLSLINYVAVSGEMPIIKRDRNLRLFKNDVNVKCLLITGIGRYGLNLQAASILICMGIPKNKFDLDQLLGRLNRINQVEDIICYIPYHKNSMEEFLLIKIIG